MTKDAAPQVPDELLFKVVDALDATQVARLDEASAVPAAYPYWHQALKAELTVKAR